MLHPLFSIGFRPFFLAAGWFAALWVLLWVSHLFTGTPSLGSLHPILWHGHEMLFGFAAAVIAGFTLTAAQNWTGLATTTPARLAALVGLWCLARLGFLFPEFIPLGLTSLVDLSFFPLLTLLIARVVLQAGNRNNYVLIAVLAGFALLNLAMHLEFHGRLLGIGMPALQATVYLATLLLVFMGGRVTPSFTRGRLPDLRVQQWPWLDWSTLLVTFVVVPGYFWLGQDPLLAPLLLLAAGLNLIRVLAWRPWGTWRVPLLWVLHMSYSWIPIGFGLQAAHLLGAPVSWSIGVHALMIGALGGLTLGMMARVALGHTGRPLKAHPMITMGFVLLTLAAVTRLGMDVTPLWGALLLASGLLWAGAFGVFAAFYTPILLAPRKNP